MQDRAVNGEPAIDPIALRRAFGTFVTGVTVITTRDADGRPRGMTANSFTAVSLDPPLLLVCVGKTASSFPAFSSSDCFAVNLLHEGQREISTAFASKTSDKFASVGHDRIHTGAPVLADSLTWFDCSVHNRVDAGDHVVLIGQIWAFGTSEARPLGFCRGHYASVGNPLPAGPPASHSTIIGYLVEADGRILLRSDGKGGWALPLGPQKADGQLELDGANALPLIPEETSLYSAGETADSGSGYLVYWAQLAPERGDAALPESYRFFGVEALPYDDLATPELRSLLRRFSRERNSRVSAFPRTRPTAVATQ